MATEKLTQLPNYTTPSSSSDILPIVDVTNTTTKKITLANLLAYIFTPANIPAGGGSPITRDNESQLPFVASGGVWSGDAYASTRNASMTALVCYINGRRISISIVTARAFTASKDTYIDVLDNADGTGTLVYTEVTNNAASPALAANSLRIGIIVTGATNIAAVGSVNQGQITTILPIASSIAYSVTDSLGNLICPRDPAHRRLGYRQIVGNFNSSSASAVQITGLTCPVIVPANREVKVTSLAGEIIATALTSPHIGVWDGTVGSGTLLNFGSNTVEASGHFEGQNIIGHESSVTGSKTYNASFSTSGGSSTTIDASSTQPAFILVELG